MCKLDQASTVAHEAGGGGQHGTEADLVPRVKKPAVTVTLLLSHKHELTLARGPNIKGAN